MRPGTWMGTAKTGRVGWSGAGGPTPTAAGLLRSLLDADAAEEEDLPAHRMFLDGMAKYAPSLQPPSDSMALRAYIAADLMVRGLEEVGPCPTREAFIPTLRGVDDFDGAGLLPGKLDLAASFGLPNTCYIFVRVDPSGSRFETVDPSPLCGTPLPSGAETHQRSGDLTHAVEAYAQALAASERCGSVFERARAHHRLGHLNADESAFDRARWHWAQALTDYRQLGAPEATNLQELLSEMHT